MTNNKKYYKLFNEEGHLTEEGIAVYADALFNNETERLPEILPEHVMVCPQCKQDCFELFEILQLQAIDNEDVDEEVRQAPEVKEPGINYQAGSKSRNVTYLYYLKRAAIVVLLAGLGRMIVYWARNMRQDNEKSLSEGIDVRDKSDSLQKVKVLTGIQYWVDKWVRNDPGLETTYRPDARLEALVRLSFRSDDFKIHTPDSISEYREGAAVLFNWSDKSGKELLLKVMDNTGKLVHQRRLEHHASYEFRKTSQPGLYYWFFEQNKNTVAAGRFGVVRDQ